MSICINVICDVKDAFKISFEEDQGKNECSPFVDGSVQVLARLRCLTIIKALLENISLSSLPALSTPLRDDIFTLLNEVVIPSINSSLMIIQLGGLRCLSLMAITVKASSPCLMQIMSAGPCVCIFAYNTHACGDVHPMLCCAYFWSPRTSVCNMLLSCASLQANLFQRHESSQQRYYSPPDTSLLNVQIHVQAYVWSLLLYRPFLFFATLYSRRLSLTCCCSIKTRQTHLL